MEYKLSDLFEKPISGEWGNEIEEGIKGTKVLRTTNFTNLGRLDLSDVVEREIDLIKYENKMLKNGDIIIEKSGGSPTQPVGRVVIFDIDEKEPYFCNNFTSILRPTDKLYPKYALYLMKRLYDIRKVLKFQNQTTGIINLKLNDYISKTEVDIPSLDTQKKIAEVLDKAQELIDKRKEQIEALDELVKSRFIEMFGNPLNNPKGFKKVKIKELIDIKIEKSKKVFDSEDIISYIDISCIDNMSNKIINSNKYNFSEAPSRAQQCIKVGDILISTVRPNLKNIAIVQYELENMVTTSGVTILRSKNINKSFLFQYVLTDYFTDEMISLTSGANYPAIKPSDIYNHEIINPPMELQNEFADFVNQVDKLKLKMETSLKELEDNFNSLMQKAFKGELF